jgi:squalene-associated FAD-dependent desaturase
LKVAKVAIVGGGYAGMAAAVELASSSVAVTVFEASRVLGGRARAVELSGITVDNGQHLLVGAYRETLRLMAKVGADPKRHLLRLPLAIEFPGAMQLAAPRLPAPLHMLSALCLARGLSAAEKWQAIRFMTMLQRRRFVLANDLPLSQLLDQQGQSATVRRYLWEPLCVATLNTPIDNASSQVFANVLRDTLAADRAASDFLLPTTDLSQLFPEPAASYVTARGGKVQRATRITAMRRENKNWWIGTEGPYEHVILAVAPYQVGSLIDGMPELDAVAAQLSAFTWEPIVTAYLAYPATVRLPRPMLAFADAHTQWLFDRGQLGGKPGLMAAVISARGRHMDLDNDTLAARIHDEIAALIPGLPAPGWQRVIVEKRATFSCTPGLSRPISRTALDGLWLAGDYIESDYPATIESAVRCGVAVAAEIIATRQPQSGKP